MSLMLLSLMLIRMALPMRMTVVPALELLVRASTGIRAALAPRLSIARQLAGLQLQQMILMETGFLIMLTFALALELLVLM